MLYRYLPWVKLPTACLWVTTLLPSYRGRMFSSLGFGSGLVIVNATWEYLCFWTYFNIIISDNQVLQFWECTFRQGYSLRVWESDSSWSYQSEMTWRTVCGTQRWPSGYHQIPCTEPYMKSRHQLTRVTSRGDSVYGGARGLPGVVSRVLSATGWRSMVRGWW